MIKNPIPCPNGARCAVAFGWGRMSRADAIAGLIEHMQAPGDVWFAPLDDIAARVRKVVADGAWTPRVDLLAYYDRPVRSVPMAAGVLPS